MRTGVIVATETGKSTVATFYPQFSDALDRFRATKPEFPEGTLELWSSDGSRKSRRIKRPPTEAKKPRSGK